MNVLGLFDGISGGMQSLKKAKVDIDNYYASEINKYAIKTALKNHPEIKQIGDVTGVKYKNGCLYTDNGAKKTQIDLLIGGSPCQGFSFAGKQLNFEDYRSKLFFSLWPW